MQEKFFTTEIRRLREAEGFSQSQAANAWGVSVKTLQGWERETDPITPRPFIAKCILFYIRWRKCAPAEKRPPKLVIEARPKR